MLRPPRSLPAKLLLCLCLAGGLALVAHAAPVPVKFDPVAETEKLLATLPADARAKSDAYFEGGYIIQVWNLALGLVLSWLLLKFGVTVKLRDCATGPTGRKVQQWALLAAAYALLFAIIFALGKVLGRSPGVALDYARLFVAALVPYFLLRWKLAGAISRWADRPAAARYLQGVLFLALFTVVSAAIDLPNDYYLGFIREHRFGLSNLTTGGWLGEQAKGLMVSVVLGSLIGSLLYVAIRKWAAGWWVRAAIATPFFALFLGVIAPVFIAPLFNHYTPLADAKIRDPILSMARANGVPVDKVLEFDASKQTKRISANVSGAFSTIRVSLNDNLLKRCTPNEIQAVMGHELGHYVLNHVYRGVVYFSLLFAAGFWFTNWFYGWATRRWGAAWGLRGIDDFAGLPVLLAGLSIFLFLATPVRNSIIRTAEQEADYYGLNAARQPDGFATTALKLSEYRKLKPGPWEEIIFYDHPSGYTRILTAMRWKAEHLGEFNYVRGPTKE
ncbi:MAG: M48 family metallopeptidase [Opitutae bacterium]|nr:M48 family metallopeptidase [Opitutae bacterium]